MARSEAALNALIARAYAGDPSLTSKDVNAMLRGCFMASPGNVLVVADFNAVEPRTLAWASGDQAALEAFRNGDPYVEQAAQIYHVPPAQVAAENAAGQKTKRNLGKASIIGCGYGLGNPDKFRDIAAKQFGVDWSQSPVEPAEVIAAYRRAHPEVVKFWRDMQDAAVLACDGYTTSVGPFTWGPSPLAWGRDVWMMLPSGRPIVYYKMKYTTDHRGRPDVTYIGNKQGRVCEIRVYGGLFTENGVQALDRDLLALAMVRAEDAGYPVVMDTHDELVLDVPRAEADTAAAFLDRTMAEAPAWAEGLPLKAEVFIAERYTK